jgi:chitinase
MAPTTAHHTTIGIVLALAALIAGIIAIGTPTPASAAFSVSVGNATLTEGDPGSTVAQVPVGWSLGPTMAIVRINVVPLAPANANDIDDLSVTFTAQGTGNTVVNVPVFGDLDREATQIARVDLTFDGITDGSDTGTITVLDNDTPNITINNRTTAENAGPATHTLTLSKAIDQETRVRVTSANGTASAGSDFGFVSQVVVIPAGQTTRPVSVNLNNDGLIELASSETYTLNLTAEVPGQFLIGAPSDLTASGTITDFRGANTPALGKFQLASDSVSFVCRQDLPVIEAFVNPATTVVRLELDHAMSMPFEFRLTIGAADGVGPAATAGTDFIASSVVRIFPANTTALNFGVTVLDDGVSEGDEFIGLLANGGMIAEAQACNQNLNGANNQVKILINAF